MFGYTKCMILYPGASAYISKDKNLDTGFDWIPILLEPNVWSEGGRERK